MASLGYNEADTRAKLIDPALHQARWVECVSEAEREAHGEIQREQSAVRIDILDGKRLKRGRGRVDYLLRAHVGGHEQPLTLAFVEAKKERALPTSGLEQVKEYARRHAVKHGKVAYETTENINDAGLKNSSARLLPAGTVCVFCTASIGFATQLGRPMVTSQAHPIALANLMLHGIDEPHLWHGNTLSRQTVYGGLYEGAPERFHVVLTNPPFGGKEGKEAQSLFPFKTRATQVLFVQYLMQILEPGGRCGVVLDEGFLYRTNEEAFVRTKRKLLDENDLWCIVSLPGGAFTGSGAGVTTNLVFFTRGRKTERIWYYDLSHIKVGKKNPLTLQQFGPFFELIEQRGTPQAETEHSWTIDFAARRQHAAAEAAPHRREAEAQREQALALREQAKALRKADREAEAERALLDAAGAERAARDSAAKAQALEDAVYDLKAVNPAEKKVVDARTPAELLQAIADKGKEVDDALDRLKALMQ